MYRAVCGAGPDCVPGCLALLLQQLRQAGEQEPGQDNCRDNRITGPQPLTNSGCEKYSRKEMLQLIESYQFTKIARIACRITIESSAAKLNKTCSQSEDLISPKIFVPKVINSVFYVCQVDSELALPYKI